ncbi:MAG: pilus assembly protein [Proteobacteria bacterium]|nr:pilus assembly protein [Pseudomonadota bacterium]
MKAFLHKNQSGQSMVELLVVLPVMMLLIFGAIQFALIYHAKITLNYAAFEAVRAGTLNHAEFDAVKEGFARGLAPLYSYTPRGGDLVAGFQVARERVLKEFDTSEKLVRIERLNPGFEAFEDFALETGDIPNDNLKFRSSRSKKPGHKSIQDANILHIRVTYFYPLHVPMVSSIISSAVCLLNQWRNDPACASKEKRIPLTAVAAMRMQTRVKNSKEFYKTP